MRVILKQDVKKVGKKGEIVEVSDGYGRNYLIARGLAVLETKTALHILDQQKQEAAQLEEEKRQAAEALKAKIEALTLTFSIKTGKEGRTFGSVSTKQIAQSLLHQEIKIDKKKVLDTHPIASLGISNVRVELYKGVIATIKVKVIASEN